jgi:hypothetical protein
MFRYYRITRGWINFLKLVKIPAHIIPVVAQWSNEFSPLAVGTRTGAENPAFVGIFAANRLKDLQ